jgi:hypothetical protein
MAEELRELIFNFNEVVNYVKKNYIPPKHSIIKEERIRIKIHVLNFFDILLFSNLSNNKSYLEFYKHIKDKENPEKLIKQRNKVFISKIFGYDQDYSQILSKTPSFLEYREDYIKEIEVGYYSISCKKIYKQSGSIKYDNIKGNIVRKFYEDIGNWRLIGKDKTDLNVETNFQRKNFIKDRYSTFSKILGLVEIEYIGNIFEDKIDFIDLEKCLSIIFLVKSPLQIYYGIPDNDINMKTIEMGSKELLNLDPSKTMITTKIDGQFVYFYIPMDSNITYIWKAGELITRTYKSNPIVADKDIYGCGEFYRKEDQKCLYVFYIYSSLPRYESYTQEIINIFPEYVKDSYELNIMYSKHIGPFPTNEMLYSNIADLMTTQNDLMTDGIIIVKTDLICNSSVVDYKYKTIVTADILSIPDFSVSYKGCYHAIDNKTGELTLCISIIFYSKDGDKDIRLAKKSIPANNNFNYDENSMCFIVKNNNPTFGPEDLIIPNKNIVEVNIKDYSIERFRIDKTNRFYFKKLSSAYSSSIRQDQYFGNPYIIVKKLMDFESSLISYEQIKKLGEKYNIEECFSNLLSAKTASTTLGNILNAEKLELGYFKSDKDDDYSIRSSIGILSNFIKTEFIQITQNKMLNNNRERNVLDIDAGPLKDSEKHFYAETKLLVATDVDSHAEQKALEIYNKLKQNKSNYFPMKFILGSITQKSYASKIKEIMGPIQFNFMYWFFAMHYSWSEEYFKSIKDNIKSLLKKEHGKLSILTFNGNNLRKLLINMPRKEKVFMLENNISFIVKMSADNKRIEVSYQNFKSSYEENLVDIDELIRVMGNSGLILYDYFTGLEIINRNKSYINIAPDIESNISRNRFISTIKNNLSILTEDAELWLSNIVGLTFLYK